MYVSFSSEVGETINLAGWSVQLRFLNGKQGNLVLESKGMLSWGKLGYYCPDINHSWGARGQVRTCTGSLGFLHLFGKCLVLVWIRDEIKWPLNLTPWHGGLDSTLPGLGLCTAFCCESTSPIAQLCFANIKISLSVVQCRFLPKPWTAV